MAQIKVVILTGSQTRHRYYANFLSEKLDVIGVITEPHIEYFDKQRKESNRERRMPNMHHKAGMSILCTKKRVLFCGQVRGHT